MLWFPWRCDSALSRNNANTLVEISLKMLTAVRHCYVCDNGHGDRDVFYGYEIVVCGLLLVGGVSSCWEIAREGPAERVSCGSRELLQWMMKVTVDGEDSR
jgi:hypothetical protein